MFLVSFIHPDGRSETHSAQSGDTVFDCALDNNVEGIVGQCGGACNCCTCHCYVDKPWLDLLTEKIQDEVDLLEYAFEPKPNSRLACQIVMTDEINGITVYLPNKQ